MKRLLFILLLSGMLRISYAQSTARIDSFSQILSPIVRDSLRRLLSTAVEDTNRVLLFHQIVYPILFSRPDSAMYFAQEGLKLARQINFKKGESLCKTDIGSVWWILGDYSKANGYCLDAFRLAKSQDNARAMEWSLAFLCSIERDQENFHEALSYCVQGAAIHQLFTEKVWNVITGSIYQEMNMLDSALFYLQHGDSTGYNSVMLGHTYAKMGNKVAALDFYNRSLTNLNRQNNLKDVADAYIGLANLYLKDNKIDSSIHFGETALALAQNSSFKKWAYEACLILSMAHEKKDPGKALYYHKLAMTAKDSMFNVQTITQSLSLRFNEQIRQQQIQTEETRYKNRVRTYVLLAAMGFFLIAAIILWRNNRQKQKAKRLVEIAYEKLKSAQAQLIQSEKMASLGELTAGIAHEIQNPLNFVNNFSDVNKELVDELKSELNNGNVQMVSEIADTIKDNEDKINQHGKRADAIVKGMLQHSRISSGQKEPTDINVLADEYLRLAYHGLRAKDKSFNAKIETNFDPAVGKINVVPQEIGRVILNLVNNAFYSVNEKQKHASTSSAGQSYEPAVTIKTKKSGDVVLIFVEDNGNGIAANVLDKIFQPFFTTKPAGQGTGLGLSLAYDTVKAHGGELKVETMGQTGVRFIIQLIANDR